jgi:hypothetical protein
MAKRKPRWADSFRLSRLFLFFVLNCQFDFVLIQDLEQHVKDIRVRLFNLIEKNEEYNFSSEEL